MSPLAIVNGELLDPDAGRLFPGAVYVADGKIAAVGEAPDSFTADLTIDARGWIVAPGMIDLSANLREPGLEHKATIASETRAAAKAGITTLCCSPETMPVVDTPAVVELIHEQAAAAGYARVLPIGALTLGLEGKQLSEMYALKQAGCRMLGNGLRPLINPLVWRRALEYAATYDLLVTIRPQDPWLAAGGCAHQGPLATRLGLPAIPASAETVAVAQLLELIGETGARVHFTCLSTARAAAMIGAAKHRGLPVTADVSAHQLHLVDQQIGEFDSQAHVIPPLRSIADREGLRRAVAEGVIDAICSDHQPHEEDAKLEAFALTEPGISALETFLPLVLKLVDEAVLSLPEAWARMTQGPASILGLKAGSLTEGAAADLCIFDPQAHWVVDSPIWLSQGRNTPFWGQTMKGRVRCTVLEGTIVYRD